MSAIGDNSENTYSLRVLPPMTLMRLRWSGPFRSEPADHDAVARAAFNATVHHTRSSIMVLAAPSSSVSPASTSPPWKCAQSVATGIWTDERTGELKLYRRQAELLDAASAH